MAIYRLAWKLRRNQVRLLLFQGDQEILRARLPAPELPEQQASAALLESLARWLDATLHVVLAADDPCDGFFLGLTDERGTGLRTPYYDVSVVEVPARGTKLGADREFRSLRQLCLFERRARCGR